MTNRMRLLSAGSAIAVALSFGLAVMPSSAEAGWKWVNVDGDCVSSCDRDDCPCYSALDPAEPTWQ